MAGTLTRLQMATEVLDILGRSSVGQTRSGTTLANRAVTWLDRAGMIVARKHSLLYEEATASTAANTKEYAFPTNIRSIHTIRLENGLDSRKLDCVLPWTFDRFVPRPEALTTSTPHTYIPDRACLSFELFPIPDAVYTLRLRYSYWPSLLSSDSSTSDYSHLDDVLIYFAAAEGFKWLQELNDSKYWEERGMNALNEAIRVFNDFYPDWAPTSLGFSSDAPEALGEYYNNPFIASNP